MNGRWTIASTCRAIWGPANSGQISDWTEYFRITHGDDVLVAFERGGMRALVGIGARFDSNVCLRRVHARKGLPRSRVVLDRAVGLVRAAGRGAGRLGQSRPAILNR